MTWESRDLLNYALTVAVLVLTFFVAWILWYVARLFRDVERAVHEITNAVEKFNAVLDFTKEKISNASALIPLAVKGAQQAVEFMKRMHDSRDAEENTGNKHKKRKG